MATRKRGNKGNASKPKARIYRPGPRSLHDYLSAPGHGDVGESAADRWALILNDAIYKVGRKLGIEGMYFVTPAGRYPVRFVRAPGQGSRHKAGYQTGPSLFFAPFTVSEEEWTRWAEASIVGKLEHCYSGWKHQALSDRHPVFPIWTAYFNATSFHWDEEKLPAERKTPFTVGGAKIGGGLPFDDIPGALIDVVKGSVFCTWALEAHERANHDKSGFRHLRLKSKGPKLHGKLAKWIEDQIMPNITGDPTLDLLQRIMYMIHARPDHMVTYQEARSSSNHMPTNPSTIPECLRDYGSGDGGDDSSSNGGDGSDEGGDRKTKKTSKVKKTPAKKVPPKKALKKAKKTRLDKAPAQSVARFSCLYCRKRKRKCDKGTPCNLCRVNGQECVYPASARRSHVDPAPADSVIGNEEEDDENGELEGDEEGL